LLLFAAVFISNSSTAQGLLNKQELVFTKQDSLRGSITKERACGRELIIRRESKTKTAP
jgi:hypothetical protein